MIKYFVDALLKRQGLQERFETEATVHWRFTLPAHPDLVIIKEGDEVIVGTAKPGCRDETLAPQIRYSLDRNWLPLQYVPKESDSVTCNQDDLWERDILIEVLRFDEGWAQRLEAAGYLDAAVSS